MAAVWDWLVGVSETVVAWAIAHPIAAAVITTVVLVTAEHLRESKYEAARFVGRLLPAATGLFVVGVTASAVIGALRAGIPQGIDFVLDSIAKGRSIPIGVLHGASALLWPYVGVPTSTVF